MDTAALAAAIREGCASRPGIAAVYLFGSTLALRRMAVSAMSWCRATTMSTLRVVEDVVRHHLVDLEAFVAAIRSRST